MSRRAAASGRATLKVDRVEHRGGGMLDVDASIVSATGSTVVQNNAPVSRQPDFPGIREQMNRCLRVRLEDLWRFTVERV
jgi:tRNA U54 and U55 pseudouridine synthase Pus10